MFIVFCWGVFFIMRTRNVGLLSWLVLVVLLAVAFPGTVWAGEDTVVYELQGQRFKMEQHKLGPDYYLSLEDPALKKLMSQTSSRLSLSANGRTLIVFCPLQQTTISLDDAYTVVDGKKCLAPGRMKREGDSVLLEPELLFSALGLSAVADGDVVRLMPTVGVPVLSSDDSGRIVKIGVSTAVRWTSRNKDDSTMRLVFPGCAYSGHSNEFAVDDVLVKVSRRLPKGSSSTTSTSSVSTSDADNDDFVAPRQVLLALDGRQPNRASSNTAISEASSRSSRTSQASRSALNPEQDVIIDLTFPANWKGSVHRGLATSEAVVSWNASYPRGQQSLFVNATFDRLESGTQVNMSASDPFAYYWDYSDNGRRLVVDMPGVANKTELPAAVSGLPGVAKASFRAVGSSTQPVLRFEANLQNGYGFSLSEKSASDNSDFSSVVLRVSREDTLDNLQGNASTSGYVCGGRGVIVLDPGHGGGDSGCVNRRLGVAEKTVTLDVALRLKDILESRGWTVILTRDSDRDVSWRGSPDQVELQSRCNVGNQSNVDYFISLHCNASVSSSAYGSSIYWYKDADYTLARWLKSALGSHIGLVDCDLRREGFYVLRNTYVPAVLVEMAFLTNPREGAMLADSNFRQRIADELAGALEKNIATGNSVRSSRGNSVKSAP